MENFIVSARKYRPTNFESVVGQSHITTTLKNAIKSNHLAQAFLFCGPRGVGKTTCARILAKTINCTQLQADGEACGTCQSCKSFQENTSFAIHELDAASNNSVEDIRNLIDQVRYPPQDGKYKIYIIDEVHMLSTAAFNAFLKTLEEPPSYAIFILATTEKHKILPTILSRCQIFDFNRIQWRDMADHLSKIAAKEGIIAEKEALDLISIKADGGLRDALSMFDLNVTYSTDNTLRYQDVLENLHVLDSDYYFKLTQYLTEQNHTEILMILHEIIQKGFDGHLFLSGLMEHFRNLLFAKDPRTLSLMDISEENKQKFKAQTEPISASYLLSAMNLCANAENQYKAAKNPRLLLELTLLKINYLPSVFKPSQTVAPEVESGKKSKQPSTAAPLESNPVSAETPVQTKTIETPAEVVEPIAKQEEPEIVPVTEKLPEPEVPAARPKLASLGIRSTKPIATGKSNSSDEEKTSANQVLNEAFTEEQLITVWNQIAGKFKKSNLINKYVMMNREIHLIDGQIHLKVENEVQVQQFNETIRLELLTTLREKLRNSQIDLVLDVIPHEETEKKSLYTQEDKYKFLVEKHPILAEMKQTFGLDYEY